VPLVLLKRYWWAGFNGIYLEIFGSRMWEILIFKWFLALKIQINSPKKNQVLEGKISWGCGNTWAKGTSHTSKHGKIGQCKVRDYLNAIWPWPIQSLWPPNEQRVLWRRLGSVCCVTWVQSPKPIFTLGINWRKEGCTSFKNTCIANLLLPKYTVRSVELLLSTQVPISFVSEFLPTYLHSLLGWCHNADTQIEKISWAIISEPNLEC
jgi:hypothetical protein